MCGVLGRCFCGDEQVCDILTCACLEPVDDYPAEAYDMGGDEG